MQSSQFTLQSELEAIQTNAMGRVGWGGVGYYSESKATHFGLQLISWSVEVGQLDRVWQYKNLIVNF